MRKDSLRLWLVGTLVGAGLGAAGPAHCADQGPFRPPPSRNAYATGEKPSIGKSVASSVKQGLDKLAKIVTPKPHVKSASDPVSLATKAEPSVDLHVAVAQLYQQSGELNEAAKNYQNALRESPKNANALLGYAQLKDRMGEPAEARRLYLKAVTAHPNQAAVHNNLALFFAGHGMLNDSASAFARAVQLQPKNQMYRNNFAMLLVKMGRTSEALAQLRAAHTEAVAYYNLGYLLEKQRMPQAAERQFAFALQADPSLAAAERGLQRLQRSSLEPRPEANPADLRARVSSRPLQTTARPAPATVRLGPGTSLQPPFDAVPRPAPRQLAPMPNPKRSGAQDSQTRAAGSRPNDVAPLPPDGRMLLRLPPTSPGRPSPPMQAPLPPDSYRRQATPAAPLPPGIEKGPALWHPPHGD